MGGLREVMEADGQRLGVEVSNEIPLRIVDLSEQSAGVVGTRQLLASRCGHAGFRAIGNHLNSVEEALSLRAQSCEAILFGKVLDGDLTGRLLPFLLQLIQGGLELFDPSLPVALMLFIELDRGLRQGLL